MIGKGALGVSVDVGVDWGSGAAGIGVPFASKTAMVVRVKREFGT